MPVNVLDLFLQAHWAMRQEELELLRRLAHDRAGSAEAVAAEIDRRLLARYGTVEPEAVAAKTGGRLHDTRSVTMRDSVAVLPITGPIFRRANLFTQMSGATSVDVLALDLQRCMENDAVKAILLDVESPGGEVSGIGEFAGAVRAATKRKPVCAYVGGIAASAAYWIAAAADSVVVAPSAMLGSIGVVAAFRRKADGEEEFVSSQSPNKRPNLATEDGRAEVQRTLDDLASVFIQSVAQFRGVSEDTVLAEFGRGGILVGRKAVKAGMADRIGTFEATVRRLAQPGGAEELRKRPRADETLPDLVAADDFEEQPARAPSTVEATGQRLEGIARRSRRLDQLRRLERVRGGPAGSGV